MKSVHVTQMILLLILIASLSFGFYRLYFDEEIQQQIQQQKVPIDSTIIDSSIISIKKDTT